MKKRLPYYKCYFVLLVILLGLVGCKSEKYGQGVDSNAPVVTVKDIFLRPEFRGKDVTVQGSISSQCQSNGCWFFLQDATGQIFINLSPNNMTLPDRMGKQVKVTGLVAVSRDMGYHLVARGVEVSS